MSTTSRGSHNVEERRNLRKAFTASLSGTALEWYDFALFGAVTGTVFCHLLVGRAIWLTMIPLGIIFLTLLHADRTTEKELVEQKPAGH